MKSHQVLQSALIFGLTLVGLGMPVNGAMSSFDTNDEGWKALGDSASANPDYEGTGGNPGGYISVADEAVGGVWYFDAPSKFLGNQAGAYGTNLTFDLKQSGLNSQFNAVDVWLRGNNIDLAYKDASNPGTDWTSYSVTLDENTTWYVDNGNNTASESQIRGVLSDLQGLEIRGEFITGDDRGDLDNVNLVPSPSTLAVTLVALPWLIRRRRAA